MLLITTLQTASEHWSCWSVITSNFEANDGAIYQDFFWTFQVLSLVCRLQNEKLWIIEYKMEM